MVSKYHYPLQDNVMEQGSLEKSLCSGLEQEKYRKHGTSCSTKSKWSVEKDKDISQDLPMGKSRGLWTTKYVTRIMDYNPYRIR